MTRSDSIPATKARRYAFGLVVTAVSSTAFPSVLLACDKCFGAGADSPIVTAVNLSMLALVLVTGTVLTGITKFFTNMNRRTKLLNEFGFDEHSSGDGCP